MTYKSNGVVNDLWHITPNIRLQVRGNICLKTVTLLHSFCDWLTGEQSNLTGSFLTGWQYLLQYKVEGYNLWQDHVNESECLWPARQRWELQKKIERLNYESDVALFVCWWAKPKMDRTGLLVSTEDQPVPCGQSCIHSKEKSVAG